MFRLKPGVRGTIRLSLSLSESPHNPAESVSHRDCREAGNEPNSTIRRNAGDQIPGNPRWLPIWRSTDPTPCEPCVLMCADVHDELHQPKGHGLRNTPLDLHPAKVERS